MQICIGEFLTSYFLQGFNIYKKTRQAVRQVTTLVRYIDRYKQLISIHSRSDTSCQWGKHNGDIHFIWSSSKLLNCFI